MKKKNISRKNKSRKNNTKKNIIRGSIKPFKSCLERYLNGVETIDGFDRFREKMKDAIAYRMKLVRSNRIVISNECFNIIKNYFQGDDNNFIWSFIQCSLFYYVGKTEHEIKINKKNLTFTPKDFFKSAKLAMKDCEKCSEYYTRKLLGNTEINDCERKKKIYSIQTAIKFVSKYIFAMSVDELPKKLNNNSYEKIKSINNSICKFYSCEYEGICKLKNKMLYKNIDIELATLIFCYSFN